MADDIAAQTNTEAGTEVKPEDESLLGGAESGDAGNAEGKKADDAGVDGNDKAEGEEKKDSAPDEYADFEIPDDMDISDVDMSGFKGLAQKLNLTQGQAQQLIDFEAARMRNMMDTQRNQFIDQIKGWEGDLKSDKEIGGKDFEANVAVARKAIKAFGSDSLVQLLNDSGLGSHPEMVRFAHRIGKALSEDMVLSGAHGGERSLAEKLYPSMVKP